MDGACAPWWIHWQQHHITGEAHSDLVGRNNEIMEAWQRQGHSNLLGRRRHDTPPGGTPRIAAVEERTEGDESETMEHPDDFIDEDDTAMEHHRVRQSLNPMEHQMNLWKHLWLRWNLMMRQNMA